MTTTDTRRLRELAEKATPGPRHFGEGDRSYGEEEVFFLVARDEAREAPLAFVQIGTDDDPTTAELEAATADAQFIAACDPQTVLALLDRLDRCEKALTKVIEMGMRATETMEGGE